jgi:hypothetical protein
MLFGVDDEIVLRGGETHQRKTEEVRRVLTTDPRLVAVELAWATGVILTTRRVDH